MGEPNGNTERVTIDWDVWAEIGENFEPIGQWPASAIDELARHSNEVWDSTTGKWEIGKHS